MREKAIEKLLIQEVRNKGGLALKLASTGFKGMPDRLVLFPGGRIAFVEVKAPGKPPSVLQSVRHKQLRRLGFTVYTLDSKAEIKRILDNLKNGGD